MLYLLIAMGAILHVIASEKEFHSSNLIKLFSINEESSSSFIEGLFLVFMSIVNPLIMLNILLENSCSPIFIDRKIIDLKLAPFR